PLVNDEAETQRFFTEAPHIFGAEYVQQMSKLMPAEDFAYYVQQVPGCFMFVGAGNADKGMDYPHHHSLFDFDEEAMLNGVKLLLTMVQSAQKE
ncbi:MAG TPA: M20/M25/M40 family metallo-hydrolase, partial [Paenibacillus sp.]